MAPVTDDLWTAVTIQGWDAHEGCQQLLAQDSVDFTQASGPSNDRVICTVEPPHRAGSPAARSRAGSGVVLSFQPKGV
jgi:hypothetical protein